MLKIQVLRGQKHGHEPARTCRGESVRRCDLYALSAVLRRDEQRGIDRLHHRQQHPEQHRHFDLPVCDRIAETTTDDIAQ